MTPGIGIYLAASGHKYLVSGFDVLIPSIGAGTDMNLIHMGSGYFLNRLHIIRRIGTGCQRLQLADIIVQHPAIFCV